MTAAIYTSLVVLPHVRIFRADVGYNVLWMNCNAPCPHGNVVQDCLESEDIYRTTWAADSPDFNTIADLWDYLEQDLAALPLLPTQNPSSSVQWKRSGKRCLKTTLIPFFKEYHDWMEAALHFMVYISPNGMSLRIDYRK